MMKKSLLALSVAAAAMGAQAADVQVYGVIDTSLSFVSSDADIAGHDRVNSFSMENAKEFGSRFGLKGSEDLGNGYKVGFVLESGFKSDDGQFDQTGKLFGREAHVDLTGPSAKSPQAFSRSSAAHSAPTASSAPSIHCLPTTRRLSVPAACPHLPGPASTMRSAT